MRIAPTLTARTSIALSLTFAIATLSIAQTSRPDGADDEYRHARAMLADAAYRFDSDGVQHARARFAGMPTDVAEDARVQYQLAFGDFVSLISPDMASTTVPQEEGMRRLERARAALEKAVAEDPEMAGAWALRALCTHLLSQRAEGDEKAALVDAAAECRARANSLAPGDPEIAVIMSFVDLMGGTGSMDRATELLNRSVEAYRAMHIPREEPTRLWWSLFARAMKARMQMMAGQSRAALDLVNEVLADEPDFALALVSRPALEEAAASAGDGFRAMTARDVPALHWTKAGEDPLGDGRDAALADGKSFAYAIDAESGDVWFRFELHNEVNADAFGVNLIIDDDADQETGAAWWGTNSAFKWDRLVTVWLSRNETGLYTGVLGVGDMAGAGRGDFANIHRGDVRFAALESEHAIVIAVPRSLLTDGTRVNVIGAVGSNRQWNDDLNDSGHATIDL